VVCLGPRVPGESVGPRPLSGVVVRPLNFTVRRSLRSPKRREEDMGAASFNSVPRSAKTDSLVLQASSIGATGCACGD